MIIIHQGGHGITNLNACKTVQLNGRIIEAHYVDGTKKTIAFYETAERAEEVFEDMLFNAFPEKVDFRTYPVFEVSNRNSKVYYLPEE